MAKGITVIYTPEEFDKKGFDGEIAKYMRTNSNTAIVGDTLGVDRHVIHYVTIKNWLHYSDHNPFTGKAPNKEVGIPNKTENGTTLCYKGIDFPSKTENGLNLNFVIVDEFKGVGDGSDPENSVVCVEKKSI